MAQMPPPPRDMHDALLAGGVSSGQSGPDAMLCIRCGHSARSHPDSSSCSHRGRRLRRCGAKDERNCNPNCNLWPLRESGPVPEGLGRGPASCGGSGI